MVKNDYAKVDEEVALANELDLSSIMTDEAKINSSVKYNLSSIVQHYGTMLSGHYVAEIKHS